MEQQTTSTSLWKGKRSHVCFTIKKSQSAEHWTVKPTTHSIKVSSYPAVPINSLYLRCDTTALIFRPMQKKVILHLQCYTCSHFSFNTDVQVPSKKVSKYPHDFVAKHEPDKSRVDFELRYSTPILFGIANYSTR